MKELTMKVEERSKSRLNEMSENGDSITPQIVKLNKSTSKNVKVLKLKNDDFNFNSLTAK